MVMEEIKENVYNRMHKSYSTGLKNEPFLPKTHQGVR